MRQTKKDDTSKSGHEIKLIHLQSTSETPVTDYNFIQLPVIYVKQLTVDLKDSSDSLSTITSCLVERKGSVSDYRGRINLVRYALYVCMSCTIEKDWLN